jgi:AraC-like DNA-binding protein
MKGLESVLCDFYYCLGIPIQFLDSNLSVISSKGCSFEINKLCDDLGVFNDITSDLSSSVRLNYLGNVHFIVTPTLSNSRECGYFVIGPFKSENVSVEFGIPFKPYSCVDYISSMLDSLIKDRLCKKCNFSLYVKDAIDFIHRNYYTDIKLDTVCDYLSINKSYFCSIFKKETGFTFSDFLNRIRVEKSKEFLIENNDSILDVALSVGYNNHTYYSSIFKKYNGITPQEYRQAM